MESGSKSDVCPLPSPQLIQAAGFTAMPSSEGLSDLLRDLRDATNVSHSPSDDARELVCPLVLVVFMGDQDCLSCRSSLESLSRFATGEFGAPERLEVIVVFSRLLLPNEEDALARFGWRAVIDSNGNFGERAALLEQPLTLLFGSSGRLLGMRKGFVPFDQPGFENLTLVSHRDQSLEKYLYFNLFSVLILAVSVGFAIYFLARRR